MRRALRSTGVEGGAKGVFIPEKGPGRAGRENRGAEGVTSFGRERGSARLEKCPPAKGVERDRCSKSNGNPLNNEAPYSLSGIRGKVVKNVKEMQGGREAQRGECKEQTSLSRDGMRVAIDREEGEERSRRSPWGKKS